jgi:hypothetical protein
MRDEEAGGPTELPDEPGVKPVGEALQLDKIEEAERKFREARAAYFRERGIKPDQD